MKTKLERRMNKSNVLRDRRDEKEAVIKTIPKKKKCRKGNSCLRMLYK